jgi:20S proteasome alpha/beta subunit
VALIIHLTCMGIVVESSSLSSSTASSYTSVTALDAFGNSQQLRNAQEASRRYGRLVVASLACSSSETGRKDSIVVCSVWKPRWGLAREEEENVMKMVKVVSGDDDEEMTAICMSGVSADATHLLGQLRNEAIRLYWDRFNTNCPPKYVADCLSRLLLQFMGYDTSSEWSLFSLSDDNNNMGRPFGISSLVLGISSRGNEEAEILSVDPGGAQQSWVARALGRDSDEANRRLEQTWKDNMTVEETQTMCTHILRNIILEENDNNGNEDLVLVCETLSPHRGVQVQRIPLVNIEKPQT